MLTAWLEDEALPFLVKNWQGWSRMLWEVAGIIWAFISSASRMFGSCPSSLLYSIWFVCFTISAKHFHCQVQDNCTCLGESYFLEIAYFLMRKLIAFRNKIL